MQKFTRAHSSSAPNPLPTKLRQKYSNMRDDADRESNLPINRKCAVCTCEGSDGGGGDGWCCCSERVELPLIFILHTPEIKNATELTEIAFLRRRHRCRCACFCCDVHSKHHDHWQNGADRCRYVAHSPSQSITHLMQKHQSDKVCVTCKYCEHRRVTLNGVCLTLFGLGDKTRLRLISDFDVRRATAFYSK